MFVKICGVTTEEDALLAVGMGADALGFNFVPGSSRQIRTATARDIVRRLPGGVLTVGVFRDELKERVVEVTHEASGRPTFWSRDQQRQLLGCATNSVPHQSLHSW